MIENLIVPQIEGSRQLDLSRGVFATYDIQGEKHELLLKGIEPYWQYANETDIEQITVRAVDNYIIAVFTVASGQGGVVTVWNADGELIHISSGSFGLASTIFDGYVYTLCAVINWGHPLSFSLKRIRLGAMDAFEEDSDEVEGFVFNEREVYDASLHGEVVFLEVNANECVISTLNKEYRIRYCEN